MSSPSQLQLLVQPLGRLLDTVVDALGFGALAGASRLLAARTTSDDLGDAGSPLLRGDTLRGEVLRIVSIR